MSVICHTYSTLEIKLGKAQPKQSQNPKFIFSLPPLHSNVCTKAKFLGKQLSEFEDIITKIAEQCLFEGMKNMSNYWLDGTAPKLLRKGRIGDWKNYFTPEQNKMFENEVMNKLIGTRLEFDFERRASLLS